jgi:hypothetical protein
VVKADTGVENHGIVIKLLTQGEGKRQAPKFLSSRGVSFHRAMFSDYSGDLLRSGIIEASGNRATAVFGSRGLRRRS